MKFTIVTPSYNKGAFIDRTIQSVLTQEDSAVELDYLILDNCSTDQTEDVLRQYESLPQVRIFRRRDRSQADAINNGWLQGQGEILAWLNADDVYLESALTQVADYFQTHPEVMALYGEAVYLDEWDQVLKPVTNIRDYSPQNLLSHDFITQPATFLRREVFEQVGLLNIHYRYVFDWDYWIRVSQQYEFIRVPYYLAGYRVTGENLTTTGKQRRLREMVQVVWRYGGLIHLLRFLWRLLQKYLRRDVEIPSVASQ
ncbi:MAG: glycosyltransferase family 2 protein [Synechococcales bacterium]|nr:glycosyltransferase family 2 protein [Synechococcales bacterium]